MMSAAVRGLHSSLSSVYPPPHLQASKQFSVYDISRSHFPRPLGDHENIRESEQRPLSSWGGKRIPALGHRSSSCMTSHLTNVVHIASARTLVTVTLAPPQQQLICKQVSNDILVRQKSARLHFHFVHIISLPSNVARLVPSMSLDAAHPIDCTPSLIGCRCPGDIVLFHNE